MKIFSCSSVGWDEKVVYKVKNKFLVRAVEIIDLTTLKRYKKESMLSIAQKAFFVFLFNPIFLFMKIAFNICQMAFDFAKVTVESSIDMAMSIKNKDLIKIFEIYVISRIDLLKYLAEDIIAIVRAPFYAIGIQLASFYTMFSPLNGRKLVGAIERSWNNDKNLKHDYRYNKKLMKEPLKGLFDIMLNRDEDIVFYLAPCFQPFGSLKDKHIIACFGK